MYLARGLVRVGRWVVPRREEVPLDGCSLFVYRPSEASGGATGGLLWIHGGGYVLGTARQDELLLARLADDLRVTVASVEYRLAPEHPFPTPLLDCGQAWRWLVAQPEVDAERVAVAGASAGGGLAAALCQKLRDDGGPQPVIQVLVYPMLEPRSSDVEHPNDRWFRTWNRASNRYGWRSYLRGHDAGDPPPYAVPARTEDLSNLPPAWIGVGTLDLFHDEDLAYADRLEAAGVEVERVVVEGAYHGFDASDGTTRVARDFRRSWFDAVHRRLHGDAREPTRGVPRR